MKTVKPKKPAPVYRRVRFQDATEAEIAECRAWERECKAHPSNAAKRGNVLEWKDGKFNGVIFGYIVV